MFYSYKNLKIYLIAISIYLIHPLIQSKIMSTWAGIVKSGKKSGGEQIQDNIDAVFDFPKDESDNQQCSFCHRFGHNVRDCWFTCPNLQCQSIPHRYDQCHRYLENIPK